MVASKDSDRKSRHTFKKKERLKSKKLIAKLFEDGESFKIPPVRIIWLLNPDQHAEYHQVLFSVPGKYVKKAVDRNKIKRRLREVYRLNKDIILHTKTSAKILIAFVYISDEIASFSELENRIKQALTRLQGVISKI